MVTGSGSLSSIAASLQSVAKESSGVASGIYSTFRYIGSTVASVMISLQIGYAVTVYILIGFAVVGVVVSKGLSIGSAGVDS